MRTLYSFILLLIISSCTTDELINNPDEKSSSDEPVGLNIYEVIADSSELVNLRSNNDIDITQLEISEEPWLSNNEIDIYDFSTHIIYLKPGINKSFNSDFLITYYLITANNEKCYIAVYWPPYLCSLPSNPVLSWGFYPEDIVSISEFWYSPDSENDIRNDIRVKNALIETGKYHGGLKCELQNIIISGDKVKYTYELKNEDSDNLYVLDPDKMGDGLFHYYTNGVYFKNDENIIYPGNDDVIHPDSYDSWEKEWFTLIEAGKTITRTVEKGNYENIPNGKYNCTFRFPAVNNINRDERYLADGRIWLGEIVAEMNDFEVNTKDLKTSDVSFIGCKSDLKSLSIIPDTTSDKSCIFYEYNDNKLVIKHINAGFNCCPEGLEVEVNMNNNLIEIIESEEDGLCDCLCLFDVNATISPLSIGKYIIKLVEPYLNDGDTELIFEIDLTIQTSGSYCVEREFYPWGIY